MRWRDIGSVRCSIARSLSVVGDRWTVLVLREAFGGVRRFEELRERTGAARPLLADRLAHLVEHGVLERQQYSERPDRFEYRLTEKGLDLYPLLVALIGWGDRWMADPAGPPLRLMHRNCGSVITPQLVCPDCGEPVDARSMRALSGSAAGPATSA